MKQDRDTTDFRGTVPWSGVDRFAFCGTKKVVEKIIENGWAYAMREVFGFLGPNAAGKTTTVRMLCCPVLYEQGYFRREEILTRWR